jgi:DNA-binding phage protein
MPTSGRAAQYHPLERKDIMKKLTALLLTLVLALSLTACGSNESKQLVGTWQMDTEIGGALDAEYTSETPMQMFLTAVFNDDGTFTMGVDTDATAASFTAYIQALKPVIVELTYQEAEKQGMTREEYDKALDGSGLTVEGLVDSVLSAFDVSALLGDIGSDITAGSYKAEKGRLYLSENGSGFKAEESVGYALSGGTMTWSDDNALLSELESMGISSSLEWVKQ